MASGAVPALQADAVREVHNAALAGVAVVTDVSLGLIFLGLLARDGKNSPAEAEVIRDASEDGAGEGRLALTHGGEALMPRTDSQRSRREGPVP